MRFAEGLRFAKKYASYKNKDGILISILMDQEIELDNGTDITIKGDIYQKGKVHISFQNVKEKTPVVIYIPKSVSFELKEQPFDYEDELLSLSIDEDTEITLSFDLKIHREDELRFVGDMLLARRDTYLDKRVFQDDGRFYYYLIDYSRVKGKKDCLEIKQKI